MGGHNVAGVGVGGAEVLHSDLRSGLLVLPSEVQRLGIGRKETPYLVPIDRCEGAFAPGVVIDNTAVNEVDLPIDITRTEAGEFADLGERNPVGNHPQHIAVRFRIRDPTVNVFMQAMHIYRCVPVPVRPDFRYRPGFYPRRF
jgi:hypothetical protein